MSVKGQGVNWVKLTGERANDHRTLRVGEWVRERLLVFNLGFFRPDYVQSSARARTQWPIGVGG